MFYGRSPARLLKNPQDLISQVKIKEAGNQIAGLLFFNNAWCC
jgi:hypothetical protein